MIMATKFPPGPPGRFLTGNLREFRRDMLAFYLEAARAYGDVVRVRLGPRSLYLVSHPDLIEEVLLRNNANFRKHYALRMNRLLLGNGLLNSEGDLWLRQRRLVQPAFQRDRIAGYGAVMVDYAERMLERWRDGEVRDVHADMTQLTLEIIAKTLFDADVHAEAPEVGAALAEAQESFLARFQSLLPLPEWVPTPGNLRLRRAVGRLNAIVYRFIAQRRKSGEQRGDLLSLLLAARDEDGSRMDDQQLRDEAMTLFLAGHDTTALALSWTWYLLAQTPEVDAKLADELRQVLGDRPPSLADLPRLHYTEHVVRESMRLYPPAYAIGREARAACELGGYHVPAGQTILMCQWVTHRDPRYFVNPEKFDPDRWEDEDHRDEPGGSLASRLPKYAYFPFGGGPRVCVGSTFALIEAVLVLAAIARCFRFERADDEPVRPRPSITLRPERGIRMRIYKR